MDAILHDKWLWLLCGLFVIVALSWAWQRFKR